MSRQILFADERGKWEIELFQSENGESSIMLSATPPQPRPEPFAMDAAEARLIAAALMEFADMQDALADTSPSLPKVQDDFYPVDEEDYDL